MTALTELALARIARLPAALREVIERHYDDGETYAEIAARRGVTASRVGQLHQTAVRRLCDQRGA